MGSENIEYTAEDKQIIVETHLFTTMRYKCQADNGFSGNLAMLVECIEHSDKVTDEGIKILAKGILSSVIQHKVISHKTEDIQKAFDELKAKKLAEEVSTTEVSTTPVEEEKYLEVIQE